MPARFYKKIVHEHHDAFPENPCWVWVGAILPTGYGYVWDGERRTSPHRWAYRVLVGPIPDGHELDHLCRRRACCNPSHLAPKTRRENLMAPGSQSLAKLNAEKTHCPQGHEYTAENTYIENSKRGLGRRCRICLSERGRRRYLLRKG